MRFIIALAITLACAVVASPNLEASGVDRALMQLTPPDAVFQTIAKKAKRFNKKTYDACYRECLGPCENWPFASADMCRNNCACDCKKAQDPHAHCVIK